MIMIIRKEHHDYVCVHVDMYVYLYVYVCMYVCMCESSNVGGKLEKQVGR